MLISETEYRYQVEEDIKPFRDVLLGLFFVTIGMQLDLAWWCADWRWVAAAAGRCWWLQGGAHRRPEPAVRQRSGRGAAHRACAGGCGEFGFVLLSQAAPAWAAVPAPMLQIVLAAMMLSMLVAPFIIERSEHMVRRFSAGGLDEPRDGAAQHRGAQSMAAEQHVIICGYGRSGQNLARLLEQERRRFIALDIDPAARPGGGGGGRERGVRRCGAARGADRGRADARQGAGRSPTRTPRSALRILRAGAASCGPGCRWWCARWTTPTSTGSSRRARRRWCAEIMEGSLMLASHALMLLGVPLNRVLRRIRETREQRYGLFRGFFRGVTDEIGEDGDKLQPRLHSVVMPPGRRAVGKTLAGTRSAARLDVEVTAVRRRNIRSSAPDPETRLAEGDVVVLRGRQEDLAVADMFLMQG